MHSVIIACTITTLITTYIYIASFKVQLSQQLHCSVSYRWGYRNMVVEIQKMQERLNKVSTYSQLLSLYRSTALGLPRRHHSHATIRTQPGTAARRKQPLITHEAKRQLSGRPAACEKRKVKRPRNLHENVRNNVPNAKSHGSGH